jgi:hypothetical protein
MLLHFTLIHYVMRCLRVRRAEFAMHNSNMAANLEGQIAFCLCHTDGDAKLLQNKKMQLLQNQIL